jgi:hypothetical protein
MSAAGFVKSVLERNERWVRHAASGTIVAEFRVACARLFFYYCCMRSASISSEPREVERGVPVAVHTGIDRKTHGAEKGTLESNEIISQAGI